MSHQDDAAERDFEKGMYKSCLKQVVAALNTTLPPVPSSEESDQFSEHEQPVLLSEPEGQKKIKKAGKGSPKDSEKRQRQIMPRGAGSSRLKGLGVYKVRDHKKKTKLLLEQAALSPSPKPRITREPKLKEESNGPKAETPKKGRRNKFTTLKLADLKAKRHKKERS